MKNTLIIFIPFSPILWGVIENTKYNIIFNPNNFFVCAYRHIVTKKGAKNS